MLGDPEAPPVGTIQDMLETQIPEEAPPWPKCATCDVDLVERTDPRTGKPVTEGGRAMMECPRCGEVSIRPGPRRAMRRFRVIRWLVSGSVLLGGGAEMASRFLVNRGRAAN